MPTLTINPTYISGTVLTEAQLDSIRTPIETLVNTTKLDSVNVNIQDVVDNLSETEAGILITKGGVGYSLEDSFEATLTTAYVVVSQIVAPATGTYLVSAMGFAELSANTTFSSIQATITYRVVNQTTAVQEGPDCTLSWQMTGNGSADIITQTVSKPICFIHIASLAQNDVLTIQAIRQNDTMATVSKMKACKFNMTRLKL